MTTNMPKNNSSLLTRRLKNKGSINEVKNAPVLIIIKATETFDDLIAKKKVTQCNAMVIPPRINFINNLFDILNDFLLININSIKKTVAMSIRYQTRGIASILINAPKTAVNPQMMIIK